MRLLAKIFNIDIKIRYFFYRIFNPLIFLCLGIRYGKGLKAFNRVYVSVATSSVIEIGDYFTIRSGDNANPLSRNINTSIYVAENAKLKIGDNSGVSSVCIWAKESITIGDYVNIGANSVLIDNDAHSLDWRIRMTPDDTKNAKSAPIVIGDGVLIGTSCIILKGVTIGDHSVIGAGSVVSKSIPANCIAAGNPCKVIKYL